MAKATSEENLFVKMFIPKKSDSSFKKAIKILSAAAVIFLIALIAVAALMIRKYLAASINKDDWNIMYKEVVSAEGVSETRDDIYTEEFDKDLGVSKDFTSLMKCNPDVVGYLSLNGTDMSVPVVQGKDNSFYLNHDLYRRESAAGIPFADYRATFSKSYQSNNITIYGNPNKSESYLYNVKSYKDIEFYKENPVIDFNTIYGRGEYVIIAHFIANTDPMSSELFCYNDYVDMNEKQFDFFIEEATKRSYFKTSADVRFGDSLITLSTANDEIDSTVKTKYRDVLVARKLRQGETRESIDLSGSKINVDMVMPEEWMQKFNMRNPYN